MWNLKRKETRQYNRKETDTALWLSVGEGSGNGQDKGRGYRGTKYYVGNK